MLNLKALPHTHAEWRLIAQLKLAKNVQKRRFFGTESAFTRRGCEVDPWNLTYSLMNFVEKYVKFYVRQKNVKKCPWFWKEKYFSGTIASFQGEVIC